MASEHIIKSYDEELQRLDNTLTQMGGIAESQLGAAIEAVIKRDSELATQVIEGDVRVDNLEREIEGLVVRLLALRQPMARDLRQSIAALKIASDLERIGDYAANVAKRSIALNQTPPVRPVYAVPRMGRLCQAMIKDMLDAYVERDADKALAVWLRDEELDEMYTSLFRELLTYMIEDPAQHHRLHPSAVHRQESGAGRRPHHQHRRDALFPRARHAARPGAAQGGPLEPRGRARRPDADRA